MEPDKNDTEKCTDSHVQGKAIQKGIPKRETGGRSSMKEGKAAREEQKRVYRESLSGHKKNGRTKEEEEEKGHQ